MAINPDLVKVGDELWDVHSERAGRTRMRRIGSWPVKVLEIIEPDPAKPRDAKTWKVSWNGNRAEVYYRYQIARLRRSPHKSNGRDW